VINAHVEQETKGNAPDHDAVAVAESVDRATGRSLQEWARDLGFADWVQLFRRLTCVRAVEWRGDALGWRIVPAHCESLDGDHSVSSTKHWSAPVGPTTVEPPLWGQSLKRQRKQQPSRSEHRHHHNHRNDYHQRSPGLVEGASVWWRAVWMRALDCEVATHCTDVTRCVGLGVSSDVLADRVYRKTGVSSARWASMLGFAHWHDLLRALPCVHDVVHHHSDDRPFPSLGASNCAAPSRVGNRDARPSPLPMTATKQWTVLFGAAQEPAHVDTPSTVTPEIPYCVPWWSASPCGHMLPRQAIIDMGGAFDPLHLEREGIVLVTTVHACRAAVADLYRHAVVGMDCEGLVPCRQGSGAGVSLIQMAGPTGPVYLFDLCIADDTGRSLMGKGRLGKLLRDTRVTKVIHDARGDARCLQAAHGVALASVFDTQMEHARGAGESAPRRSLVALLDEYGLEGNPFKAQMQRVYRIDGWAWHRRPLPDWMLAYAAADVRSLCALRDAILVRGSCPSASAVHVSVCGTDACIP